MVADPAILENATSSHQDCSLTLDLPYVLGMNEQKACWGWEKLTRFLLKNQSFLSALKMQALLRITSAAHFSKAKIEASTVEYEKELRLAVEAYRLLPLNFRAQIENWKIDRKEVIQGRVIGRSTALSTVTFEAKYKWADVACKVIECDLLVGATNLRRMQTELTVLAQLRHPNVVCFLGASIESSSCMLVTELLTGGSLADVLICPPGCKERRRPSQRDAMRWALDLARAVTYMHQSDPPVVHRDLRPAHLLLSAAGALKVTGFGSALILSPSPPPSPAADLQTGWDRPAAPSKAARLNLSNNFSSSFPIGGRRRRPSLLPATLRRTWRGRPRRGTRRRSCTAAGAARRGWKTAGTCSRRPS